MAHQPTLKDFLLIARATDDAERFHSRVKQALRGVKAELAPLKNRW